MPLMSNYPDDVQESDIPGCSKDDQLWNRIVESIEDMNNFEVLDELQSYNLPFFDKLLGDARRELAECLFDLRDEDTNPDG